MYRKVPGFWKMAFTWEVGIALLIVLITAFHVTPLANFFIGFVLGGLAAMHVIKRMVK